VNIHLEELRHQRDALDAALAAFPPLDDTAKSELYANPVLQNAGNENKFIDIKMETGTGKTYIYTRLMYELHQKYGLYKFIIVVPSLAIKEGTKNFIESDYARQHFSRFFPNQRIELQIINAGDFAVKQGRRKNFPSSLAQFCEATQNEKNTVQCLLLSDKGFLDRNTSALFKDDYDQTLFGGFCCPADALKNTRPVLIIDEPHRLKRDGKSYQNIIAKIAPLMIVRFGATFPEKKIGDGKDAQTIKDYYRGSPQFDLGAVEAFNQDLVKGVSVQFPNLSENAVKKYHVEGVSAKKLTIRKDGERRTRDVGAGEMLPPDFEGGVSYEGNGELSTGLEVHTGMQLIAGVFTNSYQELLLSQALDAHFEAEEANFQREGYKVKTNALFFIDSIDSYRKPDGWLKITFEKLLKEKLDTLLRKHTSGIYHDFLAATRQNISLSHGGYFAKDWGEADESAIAEEREDILHKERTLPFKKANGDWNTRRFFFSKWTLREGWDNPNVFTICKLRTSGSETSKIQEVGRGLRLPVDEQGNRLASSEWKLNYIIGWDEKDFAEKLVGEINADAKIKLDTRRLTDEMMKVIVNSRQLTENELLQKLIMDAKIINFDRTFAEGGYDKLIAAYPELLQTQVKNGKVTGLGAKKAPKVKLRVDNWEKIRDFWQEVSKRYMLFFERIPESEIGALLASVFETDGVFDDNKDITVTVKETQKSDDSVKLVEKTVAVSNPGLTGQYKYNEFIEKLTRQTGISVQLLHKKLWEALAEMSKAGIPQDVINAKLNHASLEKCINKWREKFAETFAAKYNYDPLSFTAETSVWKNGSFIAELPAGVVGSLSAGDIADDTRNLYETPFFYDSEIPEHEILKIEPPRPKVTVFGKLPRKAIKVPTYTGGSTTPDFVYALERDKSKNLYLLIETKSHDMRGAEKRAVEAQEKLFTNMSNVEWRLIQEASDVSALLQGL
jgi:type III restriction enzyme